MTILAENLSLTFEWEFVFEMITQPSTNNAYRDQPQTLSFYVHIVDSKIIQNAKLEENLDLSCSTLQASKHGNINNNNINSKQHKKSMQDAYSSYVVLNSYH